MAIERPPQGMWIGPDGSAHEARIKGGPLFEWFHGITSRRSSNLSASKDDLARAYAGAVWAYRCVKLRADSVAGVPLVLRDRGGEPIPDHPMLTLLRDVNPFTMNLGDLLRATEAAYNIWGVAYWLKIKASKNGARAASGRAIKWLSWLNPQTVEPQVDARLGITGYKQTIDSEARVYAPDEVIVFRNFNPLDDLGGLSPLSVALSEINAELNAARYVAAFFANDARPAGLLTTDQPLHDTDIERTRAWWARLFGGTENKWRTGIVGGGLRWQQITYPPRDLALTELRAEDRRAICAVFGVPSAMAGAWEAATYATAHEQKASFYEDTIIPQLEYMAEVLNWSLLPHYPDLTARGARLAFDVDSISALRESAEDKARRLAALFAAGLITQDEARAEMGMKPLEALTPQPPLPLADAGASAGERGSVLEESSNGTKVKGRNMPTMRQELARWERFAARRIKAGKTLRDFESGTIPPNLKQTIDDELSRARSVDEVKEIFGTVRKVFDAYLSPTATGEGRPSPTDGEINGKPDPISDVSKAKIQPGDEVTEEAAA